MLRAVRLTKRKVKDQKKIVQWSSVHADDYIRIKTNVRVVFIDKPTTSVARPWPRPRSKSDEHMERGVEANEIGGASLLLKDFV